MDQLIIIGAGAAGREILSVAKAGIAAGKMQFKGFLDDDPDVLQQMGANYSVLGGCSTYTPKATDRFLCAIGNPRDKLRICNMLQERGAVFTNLVHASAFVSSDVALGVGLIAFPNAYIATGAKIGDFVMLNVAASVGHDAVISNGCTLSAHCDVTGFAHLEEGVFMGSHAAVLPEKRVGAFSVIGAGSVVMRHVKSRNTVFGVPAKAIIES